MTSVATLAPCRGCRPGRERRAGVELSPATAFLLASPVVAAKIGGGLASRR